MSERDTEFLTLYQQCRLKHQQDFYTHRYREFDAAHAQATYVTAGLLVLSAAAAALASANVGGQRALLGVLAVLFPALSTALAAYRGLYAFDRHSKLYRDAAHALMLAAVDAPGPEAANPETITTYVNQVESILRKEQGQWGQLAREIKLIEPPSVTSGGGD